ncbi:uncharacterized protein LOC117302158 [Asterias rubens]|uniref:uncharacterized protein LOC117302158 n=1 Tax=Asterias rubens TaxID=7604 RepID=UPI001455C1C8|nr:uncharacterized protein LOC117302158 [Asterias rubens]XP_033641857.1 uncharacterized protein LOC117302158 [Asterias rubens]
MAIDWDEESKMLHLMNCSEGSKVVWNSLAMCLESGLQYVAFLFGVASLCLWLISNAFLLRARHSEVNGTKQQFLTLLHICSANVCSLIGAILCSQLGTQVLIAGFLVGTDGIFFLHFLYIRCSFSSYEPERIPYTIYNPTGEWNSPDRPKGKQNGNRTRIMCILMAWLPAMVYLPLASSPWQQGRVQTFGTGRNLLMVSESAVDNFGYTLGIFAVIGYSLAKVPLIKDGLRQCEYLLLHFHVNTFAVLANICYVLSIVMFSQNLAFLINALPWLLICGFGMVFDLIILYLIARHHRQINRQKVAARWEQDRDRRVADYEDGHEDGLEDEEDVWASRQEPRLAAINEDEEDEHQSEDERLRSTHIDMNDPHSDRQEHLARQYSGVDEGQRSPLQAIPPPPDHPRGGRRQKAQPKPDVENFGDELEWDLSDMAKTYKDEEEEEDDEDPEEEYEDVEWDEELILREVEAELRRREGMDTEGDEVGSQGSDISLESLEFEEIEIEDAMATNRTDDWYEGQNLPR